MEVGRSEKGRVDMAQMATEMCRLSEFCCVTLGKLFKLFVSCLVEIRVGDGGRAESVRSHCCSCTENMQTLTACL